MSTIANSQAVMGYLKANQRPSCRNCTHGAEDIKRGCPTWRCGLGNFLTSAMAVCKLHLDRAKNPETKP